MLNKSYFSFSIPPCSFLPSLFFIYFFINGPMGGCVSQASCHAVFWTQTYADGPWTAVSSSHPGPDEIWLVQSQVSPASQRLAITLHKQPKPKQCQMLDCIHSGGGWKSKGLIKKTSDHELKLQNLKRIVSALKIWLLMIVCWNFRDTDLFPSLFVVMF